MDLVLMMFTRFHSLSCFDDKRYALNDGVNTLPYIIKT